MRAVAVWPGAALPRTEGTDKLRRREVQKWLARGGAPGGAPPASAGHRLEAVVGRFATGRTVDDAATLEALGLSSLERVELMMALEENFQTTIEEGAYAGARTVGDLRALVETRASAPRPAETTEVFRFPAWNRSWLARSVRRASLPTWILPLARLFAWIRVDGLEHLAGLQGPVIFAANHQSHMDTPAILAALPARWRYRVAPAMAKEFFKAHFYPAEHGRMERFTNGLNYGLAALFFNAFPLPQREAGTRQTLRYVGELLNGGLLGAHLPGGTAQPRGRARPLPAGGGHDGGAARGPRGARPADRARPRPGAAVEDGPPGPGPRRLRAAPDPGGGGLPRSGAPGPGRGGGPGGLTAGACGGSRGLIETAGCGTILERHGEVEPI